MAEPMVLPPVVLPANGIASYVYSPRAVPSSRVHPLRPTQQATQNIICFSDELFLSCSAGNVGEISSEKRHVYMATCQY